MFRLGQMLRFVGPDVVTQPGGSTYDYSKNSHMKNRYENRYKFEGDYLYCPPKPDGTPWYIYVSDETDHRFTRAAYHAECFAPWVEEDTFDKDGIE